MNSVAPPWPLETERLVLRPFEPRDFDALYEMHSDDEVVRFLYNNARSHDEARALLERKIAGASIHGEGEWLSAAAVRRDDGSLVADVSLLWASEAHRQGEIGFIVHPSHHGRGYATEAARPLVGFGFEALGLHRIVGRTEARNVGSARVLEKLGMRREAQLVENEWVKGEWQSELVYAVLAREWTRPGMRKDELESYSVRRIGVVRSTLKARADAPNQAFEGAPEAVLEIEPAFADALHRIELGDELILLTWLHLADRDVLQTHPTGDPNIPLTGVFRTRSSERPNPIGVHRVRVTAVERPTALGVDALEAIDGTPIIDVKVAMREAPEA